MPAAATPAAVEPATVEPATVAPATEAQPVAEVVATPAIVPEPPAPSAEVTE